MKVRKAAARLRKDLLVTPLAPGPRRSRVPTSAKRKNPIRVEPLGRPYGCESAIVLLDANDHVQSLTMILLRLLDRQIDGGALLARR